jgi:hypothetical protein
VVIEFNIAAFMSKETMAAVKFQPFLSFVAFIISFFIPDFPGFKYIKSFNTFEEILADVAKKLTYDDWVATKLFAVALDYFTASDGSSQLGTHLRIFSPDWILREVLLSVRQVGTEGEKAEVTMQKLKQIVEESGGKWENMVDLTADGPNVNTGKDEGLFALVAKEIAHIHVQVCLAHLFDFFFLVCCIFCLLLY